jgi:hypothetical protein
LRWMAGWVGDGSRCKDEKSVSGQVGGDW